MNTYDEWQVDLPNRSATHSSGLRITVEGSPSNPSAVYPGPFPSELSALKQVQLLREGMLAIAAAFKAQRSEVQEAAQKGGTGDYAKYYRKPQNTNDSSDAQATHSPKHSGPSQGERKSPARHVTSGFLRSGRQAQHRAQQRAQHQGNTGGPASGAKNNRFQKKEGDFQRENHHQKSGNYSSGYNSAPQGRQPQKPYRDRFSSDANRRSVSQYSQGNTQNRYADKSHTGNGNGYKKPSAPYFPSDSNNPSSYGNNYNRRVLAADQMKSQSRRGNEAISDDHFKERSAQRSTSGNTAIKTVNKVAIKRAPSKVAASDKDKKPLLSLKDKS